MGQFRVGSLASLFGRGRDSQQVADGIDAWLQDLNEALQGHVPEPLSWDEQQWEAVEFAIPETSHRALCLLAAYAQFTEHEWPDEVTPSLDTDPAWQQAKELDFGRFQYPQVAIPQCWLPGDFVVTVRHALPDGEEATIGSLDRLLAQLRSLNQNTLSLAGDVDSGWPEPVRFTEAQPFVRAAATGLHAILSAASRASHLRVPLVLES